MKKNNNVYYTFNKIIYTAIMTFLSSLVFIVDLKPANGNFYEINNKFYKFLTDIYSSLRDFDIIWVVLLIFIFYFYYNVLFNEKTNKKMRIISGIVSLIFVGLTIIGKCLSYGNSLEMIYCSSAQIVKTIFISIGYFIIYYSLYISILNFSVKFIKKKPQNNRGGVGNFFRKHYIAISIVLLVISWLPKIIFYYPCVASGDTLDSLAQYFNVRDLCWSAKAIVLINDNVIINKHHSVLFTMVLGSIVKIGKIISSYSLGIFIFVILQVIMLIIVFTFLIHFFKKIGIPNWLMIFTLLFYCFSSIVSSYAIAAIKDTSGAVFILLYNIFLLQIIRNYDSIIKNKLYVSVFMIVILLILMIKSNSLYIIVVSYGSLLVLFWKNRAKFKKLFLILMLPLVIFLCYDKILLPQLGVTGTNKKESYSIPFMQIARLAYKNDNAISKSDKLIIDKVLDYDAIRKDYKPDLSDSVKNTYKKDVSDEELEDFWKVYFKYFKKYPNVYIASFINSTYAYFFPEVGETEGITVVDYRIGNESMFKITNLDEFSDFRYIIESIDKILEKLPFFSLFNHVAFYDWFLLCSLIYIIKKKQYKYIVPLVSLIAIFLSCLISPVNGSFRYILAIVFSMPLIVGIDYLVVTNGKIKLK